MSPNDMAALWKHLVWTTVVVFILLGPTSSTSSDRSGDLHIIIQPDLSNNISIMRNNDDASIEQPTVVSSGYRVDQKYPSDERGFLKFDLSGLPKGYRLKMATLSLYVIGVYDWDGSLWKPVAELSRTIELHAITTDWMGWSFTYWTYATFPKELWKTPGGDFASTTDYVTREVPNAWNNWTVTDDVRAWYEGERPNYGWLLKDAEEGDKVGCRVEYMNWFYVYDVSYSPRLDVTLESMPVTFPLGLELVAVVVLVVIVVTVVMFHHKWRSQPSSVRKNLGSRSGKFYFLSDR